jgi:hypothetical protein
LICAGRCESQGVGRLPRYIDVAGKGCRLLTRAGHQLLDATVMRHECGAQLAAAKLVAIVCAAVRLCFQRYLPKSTYHPFWKQNVAMLSPGL